jgi:glycosyltransferase involved in cell wall biosynthesis
MPDGITHLPGGVVNPPFELTVAAHFVYAGQVGGAEHMFYNLMHGIAQAGTRITLLCGRDGAMQPAFVDSITGLGGARIIARGDSRSRFIAEQRACLGGALRSDAILFPNYFVPPVIPRRFGRVVGVLHDLQYRHFRANFSEAKRLWLRLAHNLAVRRADRLVVISDFVRRDVERWLGARWAGKLAVIPNPVSWQRFDAAAAPPLARPYVLAVAAQYAHKNLAVLLQAFAALAPRHRDMMLVLCGADYASLRGVSGTQPRLADIAANLGISERLYITGYVDDAALGGWYRHATAFAFPSLFEGFGMPPVEALGFGLPTLISNRTALPEVTRGLAVGIDDATSAAAWAAALNHVLDAPARHAPTPTQVDVLRAFYAPERIGRLYVDVCRGG